MTFNQATKWIYLIEDSPQKNPSLTLRVMKEALHQNKLASRMREHAGSRPRFLMPARGV